MQVAGPATATMAVVSLAPSWRDLGENHAFVATFWRLRTATRYPGNSAYDAANVLLETIAEVSVDSRSNKRNISRTAPVGGWIPGLMVIYASMCMGIASMLRLWIRALDF